MVDLEILRLGLVPYELAWQKMLHYTQNRDSNTIDQFWVLEHPPIFTAGRATRAEHLPRFGTTPLVRTDRGGQITWHGPGQLVVYLLLDLRRRDLGVRHLVRVIEQSIIDLLANWSIHAHRHTNAPGVYIEGKKIGALGLRVRRGNCYHGLSLNVCPDLSAFDCINPCGYPGLEVSSLHALGRNIKVADCANDLVAILGARLGYQEPSWRDCTISHTEAVLV